jgi:hypothetical protein
VCTACVCRIAVHIGRSVSASEVKGCEEFLALEHQQTVCSMPLYTSFPSPGRGAAICPRTGTHTSERHRIGLASLTLSTPSGRRRHDSRQVPQQGGKIKSMAVHPPAGNQSRGVPPRHGAGNIHPLGPFTGAARLLLSGAQRLALSNGMHGPSFASLSMLGIGRHGRRPQSAHMLQPVDELEQIFRDLDTDNNGAVDLKELQVCPSVCLSICPSVRPAGWPAVRWPSCTWGGPAVHHPSVCLAVRRPSCAWGCPARRSTWRR